MSSSSCHTVLYCCGNYNIYYCSWLITFGYIIQTYSVCIAMAIMCHVWYCLLWRCLHSLQNQVWNWNLIRREIWPSWYYNTWRNYASLKKVSLNLNHTIISAECRNGSPLYIYPGVLQSRQKHIIKLGKIDFWKSISCYIKQICRVYVQGHAHYSPEDICFVIFS